MRRVGGCNTHVKLYEPAKRKYVQTPRNTMSAEASTWDTPDTGMTPLVSIEFPVCASDVCKEALQTYTKHIIYPFKQITMHTWLGAQDFGDKEDRPTDKFEDPRVDAYERPSKAVGMPMSWFTPNERVDGGPVCAWKSAPIARTGGMGLMFGDSLQLLIGGEIWVGNGTDSGEVLPAPPAWKMYQNRKVAFRLAVWYACIDIHDAQEPNGVVVNVQLGAPYSGLGLEKQIIRDWVDLHGIDPRGRRPRLLGNMKIRVKVDRQRSMELVTPLSVAIKAPNPDAPDPRACKKSDTKVRGTQDVIPMLSPEGQEIMGLSSRASYANFSTGAGNKHYFDPVMFPLVDAHGCGPAHSIPNVIMAHMSRFPSAAYAKAIMPVIDGAIQTTLNMWNVPRALRRALNEMEDFTRGMPNTLDVFAAAVLAMAVSLITSAVSYREDVTVQGKTAQGIDESYPGHAVLGDCEDRAHYAVSLLAFVRYLACGGKSGIAEWQRKYPHILAMTHIMRGMSPAAVSGVIDSGEVGADTTGGHITSAIVWYNDSTESDFEIVALAENTNPRTPFYLHQFIETKEQGGMEAGGVDDIFEVIRMWAVRMTRDALVFNYLRTGSDEGAQNAGTSVRGAAAGADGRKLYQRAGVWNGPWMETRGPSAPSARTYPNEPEDTRYWLSVVTMEVCSLKSIAAVVGAHSFMDDTIGKDVATELNKDTQIVCYYRYTPRPRHDLKVVGFPAKEMMYIPGETTHGYACVPWEGCFTARQLRLLSAVMQMCVPPPHGGVFPHPSLGDHADFAQRINKYTASVVSDDTCVAAILPDMQFEWSHLETFILKNLNKSIDVGTMGFKARLIRVTTDQMPLVLDPLRVNGGAPLSCTGTATRKVVRMHITIAFPPDGETMLKLLDDMLNANTPPSYKGKSQYPDARELLGEFEHYKLWEGGVGAILAPVHAQAASVAGLAL